IDKHAPFFLNSPTIRPVPTSMRKALRSNGRIIAGVTALVAITASFEGRSRQSTPEAVPLARTHAAGETFRFEAARKTGGSATDRYGNLSAGRFALLPPNRALIII